MEHTDGDKCKIVFTSPEALNDGISGEKKLKLRGDMTKRAEKWPIIG